MPKKSINFKNMAVLLVVFGLTLGTAFDDTRPDLIIAVTKNAKRLDPTGENSNVNFGIGANVLETMIGVDYKNNSQLISSLATNWQRIDDP